MNLTIPSSLVPYEEVRTGHQGGVPRTQPPGQGHSDRTTMAGPPESGPLCPQPGRGVLVLPHPCRAIWPLQALGWVLVGHRAAALSPPIFPFPMRWRLRGVKEGWPFWPGAGQV